MTDRYERIRKALAKGPTPGPYEIYQDGGRFYVETTTRQSRCGVFKALGSPESERRANAKLAAACDPDTIRALLAERDALREALETMVEMVEMNGFGRAYAMDVARAALEAAREDGWQPIETAPKPDIGANGFGKRLLLVVDCGDGTISSVRRGYWEGTDWYLDCCSGLATAYGYRVTHWRPLPPPPRHRRQKGEREMPDMTVEHAMQLADLLYSAGYDARHKERDYDPRGCGAWQDVVEALSALSVDAKRYRWLRDANINTLPYDGYGIGPGFPCDDDLDATIDAAMGKEGK